MNCTLKQMEKWLPHRRQEIAAIMVGVCFSFYISY